MEVKERMANKFFTMSRREQEKVLASERAHITTMLEALARRGFAILPNAEMQPIEFAHRMYFLYHKYFDSALETLKGIYGQEFTWDDPLCTPPGLKEVLEQREMQHPLINLPPGIPYTEEEYKKSRAKNPYAPRGYWERMMFKQPYADEQAAEKLAQVHASMQGLRVEKRKRDESAHATPAERARDRWGGRRRGRGRGRGEQATERVERSAEEQQPRTIASAVTPPRPIQRQKRNTLRKRAGGPAAASAALPRSQQAGAMPDKPVDLITPEGRSFATPEQHRVEVVSLETPVEERPAGERPAEERSAEERSTEESSAEESAAEETPRTE